MKSIEELQEIVNYVSSNLGNIDLTLNYAMQRVYEFKSGIEKDLKARVTIDHELVFSGDNLQAMKVFNEMTMLALGSQKIDNHQTMLYVMLFQMFLAASLRNDLRIV